MDYLLKKQLHILIQLAMADNVFTDSEKETIVKIGRERGAAESEVDTIIEKPNLKESLMPMTLTQKMNFLLDSVMVVLADKKINPAEERFVRQIAKKLGFKEEVVNFLIEYQSMDRKVLKDLMIPYLIQDHF